MKSPVSIPKSSKLAYVLVIVMWAVYLTLLFLAKNNNHYHLGFGAINFIRLSFALPILLVWLCAVHAAVRFRAYSQLIKGSPEGPGFSRIASGLFFLAGYLVTLLVLGRIAPLFAGTPMIYPAVFVKNHLPVYLLLISLIQFYRGAVSLADSVHAIPTRRALFAVQLGYLMFASLFVASFFGTTTMNVSLAEKIPAFAVSHTVLLFTLVMPSILAWATGLTATVYLRTYIHQVKGHIYKRVLRLLLRGLYFTTSFAILTELLTLNTGHLQNLGLNAVLLVVYTFLIAYAIGAVIIARSAAKLTMIEVVA